MLIPRLFFILTLAALVASPTLAAPPLDEIIRKANNVSYYGGDDGRAEVAMTITDNQGRTRERLFTILRKDIQKDGGNQLYFVYFKRPSDVRKTTFLVHKFIDRDDDRWMYLPSLDLVKRIAASDKRTSFMGSNFFYEDVSGRNLDADHHEMIDENDTYYVIRNTPKDPASVEFASYTVWIDKKNSLPMKAEYKDKTATIYRTMEVLGVETIQGYTTVTKSLISDLGTGGNTIAEFTNIKYNLSLSADLFSERYLRTPPKEARQ
ncbi:MAG: outer membrane lipoprotein-sorting protein [Proteobacteria bacterium]|nr:outer membrane lipoprotein-sorting protein [Pseudomonadota bacterium]MBU1641404.1 outer membrane lipoprotein-sorting protein [Pseudomonadota bacterium]